jgi:quercetin dioxygenase-like cupin family protein
VFNLTTAATRSAPPQAAADSAAPGKLRSTVFDWEKLAVKPTKTGERREIVDSPTVTCTNFECHVTTLNPGEVPHASHRHPDEELVIVKEGLMEVTINGVTQRAGPGSIIFYASNDEHGMKNAGATRATYHVVRLVTAATPKLAMK